MGHLSSLSPFGPIFGKELRTTARRKRTYVLRFVYLLVLFLLLLSVYMSTSYRREAVISVAERSQAAAELGTIFFATFSMFSVFALGFISPVLTATSISSERLGKTLNVLLMTPITSWQIISGKLVSRMLAAVMLIGLSLPVLAVVRLLGGVELNNMIGVLIVCTTLSLTAAAIGLFYSTFMNRAYAVILLSYATMLLLYAFVPMIIALMFAPHSGPSSSFVSFIAAINPFATVSFLSINDRFTRGISYWPCVIVHLIFSGVLVIWAGAVLRRLARKEGESTATIAPQDYIPYAATAPVARPIPAADGSVTSVAIPPPLPVSPGRPPTASSLTYAPPTIPRSKAIKQREVSDNPVLWREIRQPLMKRRWQAIVGAIACTLLLLISYMALASNGSNELKRSETQIGYAIIFCGLITLLICVLSATTIAGEKESDTWTLLLATPISARAIVMGKLLGILRRLMWPMIFITGHFLIFTLFGVITFTTFVLIVWVMVTFNTIWVATGLYLSLKLKKVTFAVIMNLLGPVFAYGVVSLLLLILGSLIFEHRTERMVEFVALYLPYAYLGSGIDGLNSNYGYRDLWLPMFESRVSAATFLQVAFAVGVCYVTLTGLIIAHTIYHFDSIVGRARQRLPLQGGAKS